jgi:thioredoxin 1
MATFRELIEAEEPVLVDFTADWCGPCQALAPILKDTAAKFSGKLKILKVNVDKNVKAANRYNVNSVPTLMLFKKGEIKWRQSGLLPAHELEKILKNLLGN